MNESLVNDEKPIEQALRTILEPLDRQLARVTAFLPLALVTLIPAVFFLFWLGLDFTGRRALVFAGGGFCALVAIYLAWELVVARMARWRFDLRFPLGTPQRLTALHILFEMESPSKAEEKLRVALAGSSPDRIVRRQPSVTETPPLWTPPALDDMASTSATEPNAAPRAGGYYDYIPLEPRHGDADRSGERKG